MKPVDFLVIGAMKAGTSSLHAAFEGSKEVGVPRVKELNFFRDAETFSRGESWYFRQVRSGRNAREAHIWGEVAPDYAKRHLYPGVPDRIAQVVPDVALVYVVRNPIERIQSMFAHEVSMGRERRGIDEAALDPKYLCTSQYAWQLEPYLDLFNGRVLITSLEQLRDAPEESLRQVGAHIGLQGGVAQPDDLRNSGAGRRKYRMGLGTLQQSFAAQAVFQRLPKTLKSGIKQVASSPTPSAPRLEPRTIVELKRILEADRAALVRLTSEEFCRQVYGRAWTGAAD